MPRRQHRRAVPGLLAGAASLLALAVAAPVQAQTPAPVAVDDEEEIVVTAILRETSLLEVPFSINAQTEEDIQRSGASTIEDLSRKSPASPSRTSVRARARCRSAASPPARSSATSRA